MLWILWDASQGSHVWLVLAFVAAFPLISELDALTNEKPKNSSYTWFGLVSFSPIFPPNQTSRFMKSWNRCRRRLIEGENRSVWWGLNRFGPIGLIGLTIWIFQMKTERSNHELGAENSPENSRTEEETSARQLEPHKNRFTSFVEQLGDGDICSLFKEIYLGMWNRP